MTLHPSVSLEMRLDHAGRLNGQADRHENRDCTFITAAWKMEKRIRENLRFLSNSQRHLAAKISKN